uniref:Uncharacterized protein n=1 Tax=Arundo donax TaxID=35708 RepID=A0A0A9ESB2_ARUDO
MSSVSKTVLPVPGGPWMIRMGLFLFKPNLRALNWEASYAYLSDSPRSGPLDSSHSVRLFLAIFNTSLLSPNSVATTPMEAFSFCKPFL